MSLSLLRRVILALIVTFAWEGVRLFNGADWSWTASIVRWAMAALALAAGFWASLGRRHWYTSLAAAATLCLFAIARDLSAPDTGAAWLGITAWYTVSLVVESGFAAASSKQQGILARVEYAGGLLFLALTGGAMVAITAQIESRFSEEEFFVAVQSAFLVLFSFLLLLLQMTARRFEPRLGKERFSLRPLWGGLGLLGFGIVFAVWSGRAYQASFYSASAPVYQGVSSEVPFLCASLPQADPSPDSRQVFQRIQALVEENPNKGTPEYGMLALVTGDGRWADAFRKAILAEAGNARFTAPANSVKYGQRLAALRVYYFSLVQEAFPDLFSDDELATLRNWFASINDRALTVEWVDWLYGLAFSVWPQGPYENQENGAGLLALLESTGLANTELSEENQDYLARNVRGWIQRYRNTDDAYLYQTEWIDNALFQELFVGSGADSIAFERNQELSFEWLLLQTLPGGEPLTYNRPHPTTVATTFYLGALLLGDPRYIWAADQALTAVESDGEYLYAQPGLELAAGFEIYDPDRTSELVGAAPTQGSCLLFSPSGLPTQVGPLAPDKIVFRDGWDADAAYLLVNLRFTGWHRYKATNSIVQFYQDGPIVVEESISSPFKWLPSGRSLFRDKRVPRENLNGLLVPRSGLSQMVYLLSGLNGPWAQDPPHHAGVEDFFRLGLLDASRTSVNDWRGWNHQRTIYFFHQGPIIVVDDASHSGGSGHSAIVWHLDGEAQQTESGLWLRQGDRPLRVALPKSSWGETSIIELESERDDGIWELMYSSPDRERLELATAFLADDWANAVYEVQSVLSSGEPVGQYIQLGNDADVVRLLHNQTLDSITAKGLTTNGLALIVLEPESGQPHSVCVLGGSQASLSLGVEPSGLRSKDDLMLLARGQDWEWQSGLLTLRLQPSNSACVAIDY